MQVTMKDELIAMILEHEDDLCEAWRERLSETAYFAALRVVDHTHNPLRPLLQDMVRVMDGKLPMSDHLPGSAGAQRFQGVGMWRISLAQCVEVFITGEVVVRRWARGNLDATDAEFLELFELLNRTMHQLLRFYTVRYCEDCRYLLFSNENPIAEL